MFSDSRCAQCGSAMRRGDAEYRDAAVGREFDRLVCGVHADVVPKLDAHGARRARGRVGRAWTMLAIDMSAMLQLHIDAPKGKQPPE